jgi:streptogramin lyase
MLNVATGIITEYDTPTPDAMPTGIDTGFNAGYLFFAESNAAQIGYLYFNGESIQIDEIQLPDSSSVPTDVIFGQDGGGESVWYTDLKSGQNKISRMSIGGDWTVWEYELPVSSANPMGLATQIGDGTTWYTQPGSNKLGRINTAPVLIDSNDNLTVYEGVPFEFTVTGTGLPDPQIWYEGDTLPEGITLVDNGDGTATLSGTPAEGSSGVYGLVIYLRIPSDFAIQQFVLTVATE